MKLGREVIYLSRADVESLDIPMTEVITAVEEAFLQKACGKVEMPPKPGIHPGKDAFIHAMPAYLKDIRAAGVKWVSGFPENPQKGLPYISGLLILNDVDTGFPMGVMDCTWITAMRTGAATAVAAKFLACEDSQTAGILGCGVQGRSNLEALASVCPGLSEVRAYDVSESNLMRYVDEMTAKTGLRVEAVESPRKAVEDSDIVVTSGPILKHPKPVIEAGWFEDGAFACPLDFDSYWKSEAMHSMNKFCTDDKDQLAYYRSQGYFAEIPKIHAELSEIIAGRKPGRESVSERIMSMHLGSALADIASAKMVYDRAIASGAGRVLPL